MQITQQVCIGGYTHADHTCFATTLQQNSATRPQPLLPFLRPQPHKGAQTSNIQSKNSSFEPKSKAQQTSKRRANNPGSLYWRLRTCRSHMLSNHIATKRRHAAAATSAPCATAAAQRRPGSAIPLPIVIQSMSAPSLQGYICAQYLELVLDEPPQGRLHESSIPIRLCNCYFHQTSGWEFFENQKVISFFVTWRLF